MGMAHAHGYRELKHFTTPTTYNAASYTHARPPHCLLYRVLKLSDIYDISWGHKSLIWE